MVFLVNGPIYVESCNALHHHLIPSLTGLDSPSSLDHEWICFPIRLGGLGLFDPHKLASAHYTSSAQLCSSLIDSLLKQSVMFSCEDLLLQADKQKQNLKEQEQQWQDRANEFFGGLSVN